MKKTVITLAVVAFAAAAVQATTTSANIVGYYKGAKPAGEYSIIANNFGDTTLEAMIGLNHLASPFSASADKVSVYTPGLGYATYALYQDFGGANQEWRSVDSFFATQGDVLVEQGSAVFFDAVASSPTTEVIAAGEVPSEQYFTNNIVTGLNLLSVPFSAEVALDSLAFSSQGTASFFSASADKISFYTPGVGYKTYYLAADFLGNVNGWYDIDTSAAPTSTVSIELASGFFYDAQSDFEYVETNPYFDNL